MKHHSRLILLISLLATSGMLGCGNDSDSGNSEMTPNCQLTQADCNSQGKTFDAENCICTDSGIPTANCPLTEAVCASANKKLDTINCICIDPGTPQNCRLHKTIAKNWANHSMLKNVFVHRTVRMFGTVKLPAEMITN